MHLATLPLVRLGTWYLEMLCGLVHGTCCVVHGTCCVVHQLQSPPQ
jgi:hypothetical protein